MGKYGSYVRGFGVVGRLTGVRRVDVGGKDAFGQLQNGFHSRAAVCQAARNNELGATGSQDTAFMFVSIPTKETL